jgi:phage terminase large subunit-like protein
MDVDEFLSQFDLSKLTTAEQKELLEIMEVETGRMSRRRLWSYYPDTGRLRRELYQKHLEFFRVGKDYRERCAMCANRIGKSEGMGGYETALHLTGLYDDVAPWWEGRRFDRAVRFWAAGKTNETTRDIVQAKLFGQVLGSGATKRLSGTGLIPGDLIGEITWKSGVPNLIDTAQILHSSGEPSIIGLKSYQQGRGSFEGTEQDGIWLDEEPPLDIYGECIIRTATTDGMIYITFTPLEGMSEVVMQFVGGADKNAPSQ